MATVYHYLDVGPRGTELQRTPPDWRPSSAGNACYAKQSPEDHEIDGLNDRVALLYRCVNTQRSEAVE